jgi:hypothetical protein
MIYTSLEFSRRLQRPEEAEKKSRPLMEHPAHTFFWPAWTHGCARLRRALYSSNVLHGAYCVGVALYVGWASFQSTGL